MKKYISIGILAILIICVVIFAAEKQKERSEFNKKRLLYQNGLTLVKDRNNPFCPEAQLPFYDSIAMYPSITVREAMVNQFFKALAFMKLGQESKAIEILKPLVEKMGNTS